jgi:hypothetical protein
MDTSKMPPPPTQHRRPWKPPALKDVGTVGEVLQGGGGKTAISQADSGDSHKPKGQG